MTRFIEGKDRRQTLLLPECLDDYVTQDNPVRVIDAFIDELDLAALGFTRPQPAATGRPGYHPAILLKLYLYGYLHRVPSSRRLEQEASRNLELIWLTGQLAPDFKTVNSYERNFTRAKLAKQVAKVEVSIAQYLEALDQADQADDGSAPTKVAKLQEKIVALRK